MISLEEINQKYFKTPMAGSNRKLLTMQTGGTRGRNSYWKLERPALRWVQSEISCGLCQKNRSQEKKEREKNISLMLAVILQSQGSIFHQLNQSGIQKTKEPLDVIYDNQHLRGGRRAWTKQTKQSAPCFSTSFRCFLTELLTRSAHWFACFLSHHIYPQFIYYTAWTLYKHVSFYS